MVNNMNVSAFQGQPPDHIDDGRVIIKGGPIYSSEKVLALLDDVQSNMLLWTRNCKNDMQKLAYDYDDVGALIKQAIMKGQFINSQWCVQKPTGPWAACDAYRIVRSEWVDYAHREMRCEYYVKFAIAKSGKLLLLVSCHLSQ